MTDVVRRFTDFYVRFLRVLTNCGKGPCTQPRAPIAVESTICTNCTHFHDVYGISRIVTVFYGFLRKFLTNGTNVYDCYDFFRIFTNFTLSYTRFNRIAHIFAFFFRFLTCFLVRFLRFVTNCGMGPCTPIAVESAGSSTRTLGLPTD